MATVIGKDPKAMRVVTCRQCASIIEYALNEVKFKIECDYGGGREEVAILACPTCANSIRVSKY